MYIERCALHEVSEELQWVVGGLFEEPLRRGDDRGDNIDTLGDACDLDDVSFPNKDVEPRSDGYEGSESAGDSKERKRTDPRHLRGRNAPRLPSLQGLEVCQSGSPRLVMLKGITSHWIPNVPLIKAAEEVTEFTKDVQSENSYTVMSLSKPASILASSMRDLVISRAFSAAAGPFTFTSWWPWLTV